MQSPVSALEEALRRTEAGAESAEFSTAGESGKRERPSLLSG